MHNTGCGRQRLHQQAGTARMIQVNVRQEDVAYGPGFDTERIERCKQARDTGIRAGIDEGRLTGLDEDMTRGEAGAHVFDVNGIDTVGVVGSQRFDIGVAEVGSLRHHQCVAALPGTVLLERVHEIGFVLAGQRRPGRLNTDAVIAVARDAGGRLVESRCFVTAGSDRRVVVAAEIRCEIIDFLVGKADCLAFHCAVLAFSGAVAAQSRCNVVRFLTAELRHAIRGIGVAIALDTVTTEAGIGEGLAALHIALCKSRQGKCAKGNQGCPTKSKLHDNNQLRFKDFTAGCR